MGTDTSKPSVNLAEQADQKARDKSQTDKATQAAQAAPHAQKQMGDTVVPTVDTTGKAGQE